ncbi:MAG: hypothetical protein M1818_005735 [Claussenomyces sp. TS43310]|nr:MAG: hypothetical protein M1818_005735 [Claussenomyces sp. TS43310]
MVRLLITSLESNSALTNHGVTQAHRLGRHLEEIGIKVSHIFSSDLQRAYKTAEAIRLAQREDVRSHISIATETKKLVLLREQDFGFYERKKFFERPKYSSKSGRDAHYEIHRNTPGFLDVESRESMQARCDTFLDKYLIDVITNAEAGSSVVVVAHGIILSRLWGCLLHRCGNVAHVGNPQVAMDERAQSIERLGPWSNTGFLELELQQITPIANHQFRNTSPSSISRIGFDPTYINPPSTAESSKQSGPLPTLETKANYESSTTEARIARGSSSVETIGAAVNPISTVFNESVSAPDTLHSSSAEKFTAPHTGDTKADAGEKSIQMLDDPAAEHSASLLMPTFHEAPAESSISLWPTNAPRSMEVPEIPDAANKTWSSLHKEANQLLHMKLLVHATNCVAHLQNLKKTRGGIGSLKHDDGQKSIESFFKKRKL